jgi:RimJ/RimL family protein N-acetyltransferase
VTALSTNITLFSELTNILFRELLIKCKDFGYNEIKLFPHKENIATIKIMLKNGGEIIGEFKEYKHIIRIPIK